MDLSKTVACTALVLIVILSAGHALAQQKSAKRASGKKAEVCVIKDVMTDAQIEACRNAAYRRK